MLRNTIVKEAQTSRPSYFKKLMSTNQILGEYNMTVEVTTQEERQEWVSRYKYQNF